MHKNLRTYNNDFILYNPLSEDIDNIKKYSYIRHIIFIADKQYIKSNHIDYNLPDMESAIKLLKIYIDDYNIKYNKICFKIIRSGTDSLKYSKILKKNIRQMFIINEITDVNIESIKSYSFLKGNKTDCLSIQNIPNTEESQIFNIDVNNLFSKRIMLSGTINDSIVDGPGMRYTIFTQGCYHNCKGCHNPQTHNPRNGYFKSVDELVSDISKNPLLSGVTISGGEPFIQTENVYNLIKAIRKFLPTLNIIIYTGYKYEELIELIKTRYDGHYIESIINETDYIIDGKFDITKKSLECLFRGSYNQRIIDIKKTKLAGKVIETMFN